MSYTLIVPSGTMLREVIRLSKSSIDDELPYESGASEDGFTLMFMYDVRSESLKVIIFIIPDEA